MSAMSFAAVSEVAMRGWTAGSRTFTSTVPLKIAWSAPSSAPIIQPLRPTIAKNSA